MDKIEKLVKYLRIQLSERFMNPKYPMNVNYHEAGNTTYIVLNDTEFCFEFTEDNGNTRFIMKLAPQRKEQKTIEQFVDKLKSELPSQNEFEKMSNNFRQYRIEQNGEYVCFSCILKKFPKNTEEGDAFRQRLWAEIIQRPMKVVKSLYQ